MDFTKVIYLNPSFSNSHSGFLCHVTFYIYSKYNIGAIHPSFDVFYLRIRAVLKWKTLLTALVSCSVQLYFIYSHF